MDDEQEGEGEEWPPKRERKEHKTWEPKNKVGFFFRNGRFLLEGSKVLEDVGKVTGELKADHFVSIAACLMVISNPLKRWDTRRVDTVLDIGQHIFSHAENVEIASKRTIKNILMGKYFFDILVRQITIPSWKMNRNLDVGGYHFFYHFLIIIYFLIKMQRN